jgi:hypothetical protein
MLYALYGWALEPATAPDIDSEAPSANGHNGHAVGASHG